MSSDLDFETAYTKLNPEQKIAVDSIDGAVIVIAGPGSGKTQLLSLRVANILKQTDALANSILCLTFTESAANNMRERLASIIGREAHKVAIHTFHSLGSEIINQNPEYFFFGSGYNPSDELAQFKILRSIFQSLSWANPLNSYNPITEEYSYLKDVQASIKALKSGGLSPVDFLNLLDLNAGFINFLNPLLQDFFDARLTQNHIQKLPELIHNLQTFKSDSDLSTNTFPSLQATTLRQLEQVLINTQNTELNRQKTRPISEWKKKFMTYDNSKRLVHKDSKNLPKQYALLEIYQQYQDSLHQQKLYDFEDMLLEVVKVLKKPNTQNLKFNLQEKYQYILVDEFQDTNGVQIELLDNLIDAESASGNPNIMVVGDDDQAIFKFQGASVQNIIQFKQKFPQAKQVTLTKNYRSTQNILDIAMGVIELSDERLAKIDGIDKQLVSMVK
ncbi:MAG: ATP-dependent helicase [Patescibacteria group bacterium]